MQNAMKRPVNQYESNPTYLDFFTTKRNGYRAPRKSMRRTYTVGYDVLRAAHPLGCDASYFCRLFEDVSSVERYDEGSRRDVSRLATIPQLSGPTDENETP